MTDIEQLFGKLDSHKIKINWNKNPIEMDLFLSFLTVETTKSTDHLGHNTGWTQRFNKEYKLIITGGIVNGVNYLDNIRYGENLSNPYNNYVNPFYLKDILTKGGLSFFLDYYKEDISALIETQEQKIQVLKNRLQQQKDMWSGMTHEYHSMKKEVKND